MPHEPHCKEGVAPIQPLHTLWTRKVRGQASLGSRSRKNLRKHVGQNAIRTVDPSLPLIAGTLEHCYRNLTVLPILVRISQVPNFLETGLGKRIHLNRVKGIANVRKHRLSLAAERTDRVLVESEVARSGTLRLNWSRI